MLPLRTGHTPENDAHQQFGIAAHHVAHSRVQFAELVDGAVDGLDLLVGHGRISGRLFQMGRAVHRNHEALLLADIEGKQAEGSDLGGGVHPDFFLTQGQQGNHVIELRR